MATVNVRYIVDDVEASMAFYERHLGFETEMHPAPGFAMLSKGDLRLLLNAPGAGGAGRAGAEEAGPRPGGWNRFQLVVHDLEDVLEQLRGDGVVIRGDLTQGKGGDQVLIEDPSGNPIELLEPN